MPRSPSTLEPRLLTKEQAAAYCAMSPSRFGQLVRAGTLPPSLTNTTRWDRTAIDAALDRHAGLRQPDQSKSALDRWMAKQDAHAT